MTRERSPYSVVLDLTGVTEGGEEIRFNPSAADRAAIAAWLEIGQIESLTATNRIRRVAPDQYHLEAEFSAEVVQACVVTLVPVRGHVEGRYTRAFKVLRASRRGRVRDEEIIDLASEDEPELLQTPLIDLAQPLIEELALALDPYPRAPGAEFVVPDELQDKPESPFAVLEKLKKGG